MYTDVQMSNVHKTTMNLLIFIYVIFALLFTVKSQLVETKMEELGVVPDVIDKAPAQKLQISYNELEVNLGNELTPLQVKDEPTVKWDGDNNTFYTLLMVDPDAPSRASPVVGEVRHWFVGNIKGSDLKNGEHITAYAGSGPPKGTGLHRYIFLLYKQPGKIDFDEPKTASNSRAHRLHFKTRKFIEKNNLGDPIAGNFYQAQWDEYVEIRNKNISN